MDSRTLDDIIARLLDVRRGRPGMQVHLSEAEVRQLCLDSKDIFLAQPNLLELEAPIKICGDIFGQYSDLLRLLEYGGFPPEVNYLFLGNYVDHGKQSLETICLLLAYKIKYPENFFLLRGNHECASINRIDGFYDECKRRFNIRSWKIFTDCFNCLPVAALIDERLLCMHGGLSPDLRSLDQIKKIPRPTDVPDAGLLCDLLWANPDKDVQGWGEGENDKGVSFTFGADAVSEFLQKHDLDLICRAHQVVEDGYEFFAKRRLVTIFSAPNFCGEYDNAGAIMSVDDTLMCSFQILKPAEKKQKFITYGNNAPRPGNPPHIVQGPRSPFHSPAGRGSIAALDTDASCSQVREGSVAVLDTDASCSQVPEDIVVREFDELKLLEIAKNKKFSMLESIKKTFNLLQTGKNKKKQYEIHLIEPKSSSESLEGPNVTKVDPSLYLELATKCLKNIEKMISPKRSNSVLINQLQCQYLFDKLRESLNDAKSCIHGLSPQDIQRSYYILESLAQIWKEVEILVGSCCDAQWIQVAMILANAKEHFTSLVFKLRLYMQLFRSLFKEGATKEFLIELQGRWSDNVKDEEFPIIDEKAKEDRQWLLSRLTKVGSIDSENLIRRLNPPKKIDAWKVEYKSIQRVPNGQVGKGASATVHKVEWLGRHFAEKCFHGTESKGFREEASLLAGLSHPNILPLFCFATRDRYCSLVMELMDGNLHELMLNRLENKETHDAPFELLEAIDIMLQVAEGMHYLHQNKVVHRDLKSMNILVKCDEHDGHVYAKVADFGLSKTKELSCTYSNLTMNMGSTRWMAPELFGNVDCQNAGPSLSSEQTSLKYPFKVDVYSFGMVCYEILTANVPFPNCNGMTELRKRIKDGFRPDLPEQCPEQLSKLIQACYHSNPATRPSFLEICVELRHIMCSLMIGCPL